MNQSTINTTTFTLTGPGATPVEGAVSYTGTTAILTPTVRLAANTPYIANVTTAETRSPLKVLQPHESEGDHQYNLGPSLHIRERSAATRRCNPAGDAGAGGCDD